jgi:NADP-dependent 3-hydroxy acid dehydrogenase YdfG
MKPVTLITGATGGIGAALARALEHHELVLLGRDNEKLQRLRDTLSQAHVVPLELRAAHTFAAALERFPRVDNVIHNAGVVRLGSVEETPLEVWREMLEVNLLAVVELTRVLLPRLREARGQAVFVNSGAGLVANASWSAYASSKFGLHAFADALSAEEPTIRVQSVYPGRTATPRQESVRAQELEPYEPERYVQPDTLAVMVRAMLELPRDAVFAQVVVNRRGS